MGLFGALNKMSGYSAENMNKVFDEFLPVMDSKAICPIGISLKAKGLFSSKPIANQKVIDAKLLNLRTQEFEDVCLQTAPKINGFPQQETNLNQMLIILKPYLTE